MADTSVTSSPITVSLQLSRALAFARRGQFREAQDTLAPSGLMPTDPLLLQAHAAIATSAGDYERALSLWQMLLVRDAQNAEAKRMIAAIELWLSRPSWVRFVPLIGALVAVLILGAGLWWALSDNGIPPPKPHPVIQTPPSSATPPHPRYPYAPTPQKVAPHPR